MTKSKKLISMLLAFVMLVTSCSLSFFAFAADSQQAIDDAEAAALAAIDVMSQNKVLDTDTAMLAKINALQDVTKMSPQLYVYALHIATNQVLINESKTVNANNRTAKLTALANGDEGVIAAYRAVLKLPDDYIDVVADMIAINVQATDDAYATAKPKMITDNNLNNLYFDTNSTAKSRFEAFWANYKDYTEAQLGLADLLVYATNGNFTNAFTSTIKNNIGKPNVYDESLNYYFGERQGKRIADLYYYYSAKPISGNVLKGKYVKSNKWIDEENGPAEFYALIKDFHVNANAKSRKFYADYLGELSSASDDYAGIDTAVTLMIDAGLKLAEGEDVDFADVKAAFKAYDGLSNKAKALIATISGNVNALFNIKLSNIQMRDGVKFGDDDAEASIEYLKTSAGSINNAATYEGTKLTELITLVSDRYAEYLPLDEYTEYVQGVVDGGNIIADQVATTWEKFNDLKVEFQNVIRETSDIWNNTETIMTSQFVTFVNGVDIDNVTESDIETATDKLDNTVDEFKDLLVNDNKYKTVYDKYQQMLISPFRYYVEGVDLNNITAENRTKATELYNALTDELKALVQSDTELYNKYIIIISSEFKDYVNSVDLDKVDDAVRAEAAEKYQALSDDAKKTAYEDEALWNRYTKIQTPDVDTDKHSAEADKTASDVTLPKNSAAIKKLGVEKSIDNVENFVIEDVLPIVTDKIVIDSREEAIPSALNKYYTNAVVGKIYSLYASLSHNQGEVELFGSKVKIGAVVVPTLIPATNLPGTLFESKFDKAKTKIGAVVAKGEVPTDEDGNPVKVNAGEDENGKQILEDANIYDAIAAIEFKSGDFGFTDGDRDGFVDAVLAALRPITAILSPEFSVLGTKLGVEFFNHVDKQTGLYTYGIYECCVKVLEALGATGFMSDAEYQANYQAEFMKAYASATGSDTEKAMAAMAIAGDAYLRPVIEGAFTLVDNDLHSLTDLLAIIPRLGDIIQSDLCEVVYTNLIRDLGLLTPLVADLKIDGVPLAAIVNKNVLPNALLTIINNKLSGLGVTLKMPNWEELNKYTTFKVNKSAQQDKDYVAVRYIYGDDMFTELVYYLYNNLFADETNAAALKDKIGGIPLVGSNISGLIDKAVAAGKLKTYAAILDYFYDNGDKKDATADAGKSIGEAIEGINATLNLSPIDATNAKVTLTKTKYAYNGKIQKPSVKVVLNGQTLTKGVSYKVKYSNASSKKIGTYTVKVTFIGGYSGKAKTVKYTIGPKNATKLKLKANKKAIKVTWKKSTSKATKGYVIQYSTNKKFKNAKTVTVKGRGKTSKTIKGLKKGKKYYVRIEAYAVKSGKKIYSPFSGKKAVKVK